MRKVLRYRHSKFFSACVPFLALLLGESRIHSRELRVYPSHGDSSEACVLWMSGHAGASSVKEVRRLFRVGAHFLCIRAGKLRISPEHQMNGCIVHSVYHGTSCSVGRYIFHEKGRHKRCCRVAQSARFFIILLIICIPTSIFFPLTEYLSNEIPRRVEIRDSWRRRRAIVKARP